MLLSFLGTLNIPKRKGSGIYWFSNTNNDWYNLQNWYTDTSLKMKAATLPTETTNVIILSSQQFPYINLDNIKWIQPATINAHNTEIAFYANSTLSVTCSITANVMHLYGNATYNQPLNTN